MRHIELRGVNRYRIRGLGFPSHIVTAHTAPLQSRGSGTKLFVHLNPALISTIIKKSAMGNFFVRKQRFIVLIEFSLRKILHLLFLFSRTVVQYQVRHV